MLVMAFFTLHVFGTTYHFVSHFFVVHKFFVMSNFYSGGGGWVIFHKNFDNNSAAATAGEIATLKITFEHCAKRV